MSWRDQLRKASFRGVEFLFNDVGGKFGRRNVTHEYPLRDKPYVEDLGRKARGITIEAFVLSTAANGFNYMPGRDALIAAIEQEGPGVLQHPTLGELRVSVVGEVDMVEKTAEGGMARFSLTFVEAGEVTFPSASANTPSIVNARADAAEQIAIDDFAGKFSVKDRPAFVSDSAIATLTSAVSQLAKLPRLVPVATDALAEFAPDLAALAGSLPSLIQLPSQLASQLVSQIGELRDLAASPAELLGQADDSLNDVKVLRPLFDFGEPGTTTAVASVPQTTPDRLQQADNQAAIVDLVQGAAVISAVRASSEKEFVVAQDAEALRTELAGHLDRLMLDTDSDAVYGSLSDLRTAMVNDLTERSVNLARLVSYTPADTLPALAIAYDLYGDAARDAELVARNRVQHPGFVRGGRALQVLTDA